MQHLRMDICTWTFAHEHLHMAFAYGTLRSVICAYIPAQRHLRTHICTCTLSGIQRPNVRVQMSLRKYCDDDSDDEAAEGGQRTPSQSSPSAQTSRRPSLASTVDETSSQIRGISEKARGKLPAGRPSFSRQNSMTSQTSMSALFSATSTGFTPTVAWVSFYGYPSAV